MDTRTPDVLYDDLDHTADIGIRIRAETMDALFRRAAAALADIILPGAAVLEGNETRPIRLVADTPALLLRAFLAELLYLHTTARVLCTGVDTLEIDGTALTALARCRVMDEALAARAVEIKAVTYHGLALHAVDDGYEATVVFDT